MDRLRRCRYLAFALALFVGVGAVSSASMAAAMSVKMALTAGDMDHQDASGDCMACRSDSGGASTADCPPICSLSSSAVLTPIAAALFDRLAGFIVFRQTEPAGALIASDPFPPKPSLDS